MKCLKSLVFSSIISLSVVSCGGGAGNNTPSNSSIDHPQFNAARVSASPNYSPSGDIIDTTPTFSWQAINNATEYMFGHEDVNTATNWHEYTLTSAQAACNTVTQVCSYTPQDFSFAIGDKKVWWVTAKVSGSWQAWTRPHVFNIIKRPDTVVDVPKAIAPKGDVTTLTPKFSWSPITQATQYQIGFEDTYPSGNWKDYIFSASQAGCQNTNQNCSYTASNTDFSVGNKKTWWVRANINGQWGQWSKDTNFTIKNDVVADTTKPVITLIGNSTITINKGSNYTDAGAKAVDDRDGTVNVRSSGNVDANTVGIYTITYAAADSANNTAVKVRTVNVVEAQNYTLSVSVNNNIATIDWSNAPNSNAWIGINKVEDNDWYDKKGNKGETWAWTESQSNGSATLSVPYLGSYVVKLYDGREVLASSSQFNISKVTPINVNTKYPEVQRCETQVSPFATQHQELDITHSSYIKDSNGDGKITDVDMQNAIDDASTVYLDSNNLGLYRIILPKKHNYYSLEKAIEMKEGVFFDGNDNVIRPKENINISAGFIFSKESKNSAIYNTRIEANRQLGSAIQVKNNTNNIYIYKNTIIDDIILSDKNEKGSGSGMYGIWVQGANSSGVHIDGNKFSYISTAIGVTANNASNIHITNNTIKNWRQRAVYLLGKASPIVSSHDIYILNNVIAPPISGSIRQPIAVQSLELATSTETSIFNLHVEKNHIEGRYLAHERADLDSGTADSISLHRVNNFSINENCIYGAGELGIFVGINSHHGEVKNNFIKDTDLVGIDIGNTTVVHHVDVFDNKIIDAGRNRALDAPALARAGIGFYKARHIKFGNNSISETTGGSDSTLSYGLYIDELSTDIVKDSPNIYNVNAFVKKESGLN